MWIKTRNNNSKFQVNERTIFLKLKTILAENRKF